MINARNSFTNIHCVRFRRFAEMEVAHEWATFFMPLASILFGGVIAAYFRFLAFVNNLPDPQPRR